VFKVATIGDWWDVTLRPRYDALLEGGSYLKKIGYLFVIGQIEELRPRRILEFGHARSRLFEIFGDQCEMWGVDEDVPYISEEEIAVFRKKHEEQHGARFIKGKIGEVEGLPDNYFDMVCSVSVVEHIPLKKLNDVYREIAGILKPGGWTVGSYDIGYKRWTKQVFKAHLTAGLEFADPEAKPVFDWHPQVACFEDGRHVLQYYMWKVPVDEKAAKFAGNFTTVLMKARKSGTASAPAGSCTNNSLSFRLREVIWELKRRCLGITGRPSVKTQRRANS